MFKQIRPGPKAQNNAAAFGLHAQRLRQPTQQSLKAASTFHIDHYRHAFRSSLTVWPRTNEASSICSSESSRPSKPPRDFGLHTCAA
jgi:hypothetical protein